MSLFGHLPGPEVCLASCWRGEPSSARLAGACFAPCARPGRLAGAPKSSFSRERRPRVGLRPAIPPRPRAGRVPKAACCLCHPPFAGRAGPGPLGPGAAAPARLASLELLAPSKMTICHSIKVSGQLMGEPGSATPGQNGLLPGIGEVQMLNAEHCALSQSRPPPSRRSGGWTAAG